MVKKALEKPIGLAELSDFAEWSPQVMKRMLDEVNSDHLKVILDVSNMTHAPTRHRQRDIINDSFDLFGNKIAAVHLKDFTFDEDSKKHFAVAGTGELMTELIFDRLKELKMMPELILDETKLELYEESLKVLSKFSENSEQDN